MEFKIQSPFKPAGDQPRAIDRLIEGLNLGKKHQTLLGVTGSGKTFTIANVIAQVQRPTLVIAHNKTLAAQLTQEYRSFFPSNAVEYFVSYYDYYQPEAYLPTTDVYIEKEAQINQEIDRLRHAATQAILSRRDVIVVASVSSIYNIGSPDIYERSRETFRLGDSFDRDKTIARLIELYFVRNQQTLTRGSFRVRGDSFEIMPTSEELIYRINGAGGMIQSITGFGPVSREIVATPSQITIFPARHYVTDQTRFKEAIAAIQAELNFRTAQLTKQAKYLEADRLKRRTNYDLEMIEQIGYCNGIENYSRYFDGRAPGEPPHTLIEYYPKDFIVVIDESHVTIPQIGGMYEGDRARKNTLIDYGFRLPSALDNRPLKFSEFENLVGQRLYTSATPGRYELEHSTTLFSKSEPSGLVEQIIRPTGLVDPIVVVKPATNQIADLIKRIDERIKNNQRVLVTTLTKKMAEDLSEYLAEKKYKVHYLHSDVETLDRIETLTKLRHGGYDVLIGVNLLREGLDLPEVSLVAILDADKEGFLRSQTSLIQTIGRAARNIDGQVVFYADQITRSMRRAIDETQRRRELQLDYNKKHKITPQTIAKKIVDITQELELVNHARKIKNLLKTETLGDISDIDKLIYQKQIEMKKAAKDLEFELAAIVRDEIIELKKLKRERSS